MSRNELIVLDPDCTALAFAAFVCAMAFCWAIWVAGSVLGAVAGVFPDSSHDPVTYPFAVTKAGDTKEARAFLTFLSSPAAREIWIKRGFKVE